jgi:hypothetical protein
MFKKFGDAASDDFGGLRYQLDASPRPNYLTFANVTTFSQDMSANAVGVF